jgi:hypothetical protein
MREEHSEIPSSDGYTYTPLVCDDGSVIPAQMPCQQVSASSAQLTKSGSLEWLRLTFERPSDRLYQLRGYGGTDTGRAQCNRRNDLGMEAATSPEPRGVVCGGLGQVPSHSGTAKSSSPGCKILTSCESSNPRESCMTP